MKPRGILAAGLVLAAVVAAAGVIASATDRSDEDPVLLEATLNCSSHIDVVSAAPDGFRVVQGLAAIQTGIVHQQGRQGTDLSPDSALRFSKIALLVRPNQEFQVFVGDDFVESTRIGWSSTTSSEPVQRMSVGPCAGDPNSWLVYAGGVWVPEPACVELVFRSPNSDTQVLLSIATQCPDAELSARGGLVEALSLSVPWDRRTRVLGT